jgi:hypothetical protein
MRMRRAAVVLLLLAAPAAAAEPAIVADARLDLIGLVERLSGDPRSPHNPESDAAAKAFAPWKRHPAVARLARMRAKGFSWDAPAQYAVYLSTPPEIREAVPAPNFFATLAGGREQLDAWRGELSDFVRVSGFQDWEARREPRRRAELAAVRASAGTHDLETPLVRFLGAKPWGSWTVIVSPFFPNGAGASWVLEEKAGAPDVVVVYGLYWQGFLGKTMSGGTPEKYAQGVWPEAVFSMTYALYEVCRPGLKIAKSACAGMPGLVNVEDCVQQTWVRGIVARLMKGEYGAGAERAYLAQWPAAPLQPRVDAALDAYQADRARARDLMDAAGALTAPFQPDGRAPACRVADPSRGAEVVYSRRVKYYLDARRAAGL